MAKRIRNMLAQADRRKPSSGLDLPPLSRSKDKTMQSIKFPVRGLHYRGEEAKQTVDAYSEHSDDFVVELEPDPTNPYDSNAIKVMLRHKEETEPTHIGFVGREWCQRIHDFLKQDISYTVELDMLDNQLIGILQETLT